MISVLPHKVFCFCFLKSYIFVPVDTVFLKAWVKVEIPRFIMPVTSLLLSQESKQAWLGMRTIGQLRHERSIPVPQKGDSLYRVSLEINPILMTLLQVLINLISQFCEIVIDITFCEVSGFFSFFFSSINRIEEYKN